MSSWLNRRLFADLRKAEALGLAQAQQWCQPSMAPDLDIGMSYTAAMKTAISVPDPAAEKLARRLGISRSELFQKAVEAFLRERRDEGITEALNAIYAADDKVSSLDPRVHQLQMASLKSDDWS